MLRIIFCCYFRHYSSATLFIPVDSPYPKEISRLDKSKKKLLFYNDKYKNFCKPLEFFRFQIEIDYEAIWAKKSTQRLAIWLGSHCWTTNHRFELIQELQSLGLRVITRCPMKKVQLQLEFLEKD